MDGDLNYTAKVTHSSRGSRRSGKSKKSEQKRLRESLLTKHTERERHGEFVAPCDGLGLYSPFWLFGRTGVLILLIPGVIYAERTGAAPAATVL